MNKFFKKILSLILGVGLATSTFSIISFASENWGLTTNNENMNLLQSKFIDSSNLNDPNVNLKWGNGSKYGEAGSTHRWLAIQGMLILQNDKTLSVKNLFYETVTATPKMIYESKKDSKNPPLTKNTNGATIIFKYADLTDYIESDMGFIPYQGHFYGQIKGKEGKNYSYTGGTFLTAYTRLNEHYINACTQYKNGNKAEAYKQLGMAMHYVCDLDQPHHATNQTVIKNGSYHADFETMVDNLVRNGKNFEYTQSSAEDTDTYNFVKSNSLQAIADLLSETGRNNIEIANSTKKAKYWYGTKIEFDSIKALEALPETLGQSQKIVAAMYYKFLVDIGKVDVGKVNDVKSRDNKLFDYQWGMLNKGTSNLSLYDGMRLDINIVPAWGLTKGNNNITVGVIDKSIDINRSELINNIYINQAEIANNGIDDDNNGYIDDVNGWDFVNNDNTVFESYFDNDLGIDVSDEHGTLVSGIIAASENNDGICGVAPNVKIMPLRCIDGDKETTSKIISAIEYAKNNGISIINCSWGSYVYNQALYDEIRDSNILFICSAGNESKNTAKTPIYPACFGLPNIISVAAIDRFGELVSSSNYGTNIDLVAPGDTILSTSSFESYGYLNGTSAAAPFVTGIAALIKSINPDFNYTDIKSRILNSVLKLDNLKNKVSSSGIVDAYAALKYSPNETGNLVAPVFVNHSIAAYQSIYKDVYEGDTNSLYDDNYNLKKIININWSLVQNADSYEIEIDRDQIVSVSGTSYSIIVNDEITYSDIIIPSDVHLFRIRSRNGINKSEWSPLRTFVTSYSD